MLCSAVILLDYLIGPKIYQDMPTLATEVLHLIVAQPSRPANTKAHHAAMLSAGCQSPALHSGKCRHARRSTQPARASAYGGDPYGTGPGAADDRGLGSWLQTPWDMLALGPRAAAGVLLHGREL